jgi:(E)-4-hydroxy-3-methylbut-2-enyl-diphosphate synthase
MNRFPTHTVYIGDLPLGGGRPVRIQSMTSTPTGDIKASVAQVIRLAEAGAEYVRLTVPTMEDVEALRKIKQQVRQAGFRTPLIADVHFNPDIAEAAARTVEKVRINPGNYTDRHHRDRTGFSDEEYAAETGRIYARLRPLLAICRQYGTALRIGTNHGSLSDRILDRYGDTPQGMVASAMEFVRICEAESFDRIVLSMKSSNPRVMAAATRLLVKEMQQRGTVYPIHLGVTEAGAGEEGRIKSAVGIADLLAEGIGDTIRVSLTEDPVNEIPVAKALTDYLQQEDRQPVHTAVIPYLPAEDDRRYFRIAPDRQTPERLVRLSCAGTPAATAFLESQADRSAYSPDTEIIFHKFYPAPAKNLYLHAACDFGPVLSRDRGDGLWIETDDPSVTDADIRRWSLSILQACRRRISAAEFISCPSCGRTKFDIATTAERIRQRTSHLTGLKIGIMGCIVNGVGEMADADYGYVGENHGLVTLYRRQEVVRRHIPAAEAVDALVALIRENGDWKENRQEQDKTT